MNNINKKFNHGVTRSSWYENLLSSVNLRGFLILALGVTVLCVAAQLPAAEYVDALVNNNKYLVESDRLVKLAEKSLAEGKYEEATKYAAQAEQQAQLSDEYVALQKKIKDANDAYDAAQARMDRAKKTGVAEKYADVYANAEKALAEAADSRSKEKWDESRAASLRVMTIMAQVPDEIPLPAQYLVKSWANGKDCLWNIAGKKEVYGDPHLWQRLYTANKSKLPKPDNPNIIEPGMLLDIPSIKGEFRSGVLEGE